MEHWAKRKQRRAKTELNGENQPKRRGPAQWRRGATILAKGRPSPICRGATRRAAALYTSTAALVLKRRGPTFEKKKLDSLGAAVPLRRAAAL